MPAEVLEEIAAAIKLGGFNLAVFLNSPNRQNKSHVKFSRYTVTAHTIRLPAVTTRWLTDY